jgi:hypothetical protein
MILKGFALNPGRVWVKNTGQPNFMITIIEINAKIGDKIITAKKEMMVSKILLIILYQRLNHSQELRNIFYQETKF